MYKSDWGSNFTYLSIYVVKSLTLNTYVVVYIYILYTSYGKEEGINYFIY